VEGHGRARQDAAERPTGLSTARATSLGERLRGPWRVVVEEPSMLPAAAPGDWLLLDPLVRRWPKPGTVVVFRDPDDDGLALKRVAGAPGGTVPFSEGYLRLADDEAWLLADADAAATAALGFGPPRDSRVYGPVTVDRLVGRVIGRYGPRGRIGRVR
jgi:signal peptidase I